MASSDSLIKAEDTSEPPQQPRVCLVLSGQGYSVMCVTLVGRFGFGYVSPSQDSD